MNSKSIFGVALAAAMALARAAAAAETPITLTGHTAAEQTQVSTAPAAVGVSTAAEQGRPLRSLSFCDNIEVTLAAAASAGEKAGGLKKTPWQMEPTRAEKKLADEIAKNEDLARTLCLACNAQRADADKVRSKSDMGVDMAGNMYRMANQLENMALEFYKKAAALRDRLYALRKK